MSKAEEYLKIAKEAYNEYHATKWWEFIKRIKLRNKQKSAYENWVKHSNYNRINIKLRQ